MIVRQDYAVRGVGLPANLAPLRFDPIMHRLIRALTRRASAPEANCIEQEIGVRGAAWPENGRNRRETTL